MTRIAHLADIHLGYRQTQRCTPSGVNQREADVAGAFRSAIDGVLAAKPDIVCIAGDLFNTPRPTNAAITFAFKQLRRIREGGIPVALVAGNHDCPRLSESGSILHLFKEIGVDVATNAVREFEYPALDLVVTAVPDRCPLDEIRPGEAANRVLVIHGGVEGSCPNVPGTIPLALVEDEAWSWVCLGDYHVQKKIAPRAWYPGSLEFVSSDIWSEIGTPKGWLLIDTESGTVEHQLVPTRTVLDLEPLDATDMTAEEVNARLAELLSNISGKIVRLRVLNLPRPVQKALDWKAIRRWQTDALHLRLDFRRPEWRDAAARPFQRRQPLSEIVAEFLGRRELPVGMDREAFVNLGSSLMVEAEEAEGEQLAVET